ncbi:hypothetical protein ACHAWF_014962 [Thalassiosira exigua]
MGSKSTGRALRSPWTWKEPARKSGSKSDPGEPPSAGERNKLRQCTILTTVGARCGISRFRIDGVGRDAILRRSRERRARFAAFWTTDDPSAPRDSDRATTAPPRRSVQGRRRDHALAMGPERVKGAIGPGSDHDRTTIEPKRESRRPVEPLGKA